MKDSYNYRIDMIMKKLIILVVLNTEVPIKIYLDSLKEYRMEEILISESTIFDRTLGSSRTYIPSETINNFPVASDTKKIEQILLNVPGVVPDEDDRLQVRGVDAQLQYLIDTGLGYNLNMLIAVPLKFYINILNIFNTKLLNKFESSYGRTNSDIQG